MNEATVQIAKDKARSGLLDGTLRIDGGVVRHVTGKHAGAIHSHLQQTAASEAAQKVNLQLDGLQQGQEFMQQMLGEVSGGIDALKLMNGLNLALSIADIGISVVGFALMNAKLNAVQSAIGEVSQGIAFIQQDAIERDFIKLKALVERYENSWFVSDYERAVPQLLDIVADANETQLLMESHARRLLADGLDRLMVADRMMDGMAITLGLRVSAAMAANEADLARSIADEGARRIEALTGSIGHFDLVRSRLPSGIDPTSQEWLGSLAEARDSTESVLAKLRTREANAVTRSAPLKALSAHGIRPRDWLGAAREEKHEPIMLLAEAEG